MHTCVYLFIFWLVEHQSVATLSAVMSVLHGSHEDSRSALLGWTFSPQTMDLAVFVDLDETI